MRKKIDHMTWRNIIVYTYNQFHKDFSTVHGFVPGRPMDHLAPSWLPPGALLGCLGALLGRLSVGALGLSGALGECLGRPLGGCLGAFLSPWTCFQELPASSWASLGAVLEFSWAPGDALRAAAPWQTHGELVDQWSLLRLLGCLPGLSWALLRLSWAVCLSVLLGCQGPVGTVMGVLWGAVLGHS